MKNTLILLAILACGLLSPSFSGAQTPTDKQVQAIDKLMAPYRQKVIDVLNADKTGQYKIYQADLEAAAKEQDPVRKQELIDKLDRDHHDFIRKAYTAAKIDNAALRTQVARILGHNNFTFGEFADIQIDFTVPPVSALPTRFDQTLVCPFDVKDESDNSMVVSFCRSSVFDCSMSEQSVAEVAGGCRSKGDLGAKFVLPQGSYSSITVAAQTDISYHGYAFAIAGYGQINAKFGIRFRSPGVDKTVMTREVFAMAPLVWYSHLKGDQDNYSSQATFSGSFSGGTNVTVQVHTEVFALSVPAFTLTEMYAFTSNVDAIRIIGSN